MLKMKPPRKLAYVPIVIVAIMLLAGNSTIPRVHASTGCTVGSNNQFIPTGYGSPSVGNDGMTVTFSATITGCTVSAPITENWTFGDGATGNCNTWTAGSCPTIHTYSSTGTFSWSLNFVQDNRWPGPPAPPGTNSPLTGTVDICSALAPASSIPVSGTSSNSVVNSAFDSNLGRIFSETKVDNGLTAAPCTHTVYGGNKPGIFMGLIAALTSDATGSKCDVTYTACSINNFQWLKTEIKITDSSGAVFSPKPDSNGNGGVTTSVWDTPHSSGDPDDLKILNDIVTWAVATYANIPMPPDIKIPVNLPNGWSYSSDGTTLVGQFTDYADNTIGPYHSISDKGLKLKIIPDFQKPDLYTVTITMSARRGICNYNASSPQNSQCYGQDTKTHSYSFYYVYEKDGGQDGDAPKALATARAILAGSYSGFQYAADYSDAYSFYVRAGEQVTFTFSTSGNAAVTLYDTHQSAYSGSSFTAPIDGTYFALVSMVNGQWGVYSFTVSIVDPPDFTISASPSSMVFVAGTTGSSTINVGSLRGFSGTVNLAASVSASGLTCTLSPPSVVGSGTSNLSCNGSSGSYTVTVTGTSGSLSHPTQVTFNVQDFTISASTVAPSYLLPGSSGTSIITLSSLQGFTGTITLSLSPSSPLGLACSLPPSITFGSSPQSITLTCSASSTADYAVTVTGTKGGLSHTTGSIIFHVVDFSISRSPSSATLTLASSSTTSTVTVTSINGYSVSTSLSYSSAPAGLVLSLWPLSVTPPSAGTATSTLDISAGSATAGTYTITITGTSGSLSHSATVSVTVAGDFSVSASPSSVSVQQGSSRTSTISLGSLNSFSGSITTGSSFTVSINAVDVGDGNGRAFGLTIDQVLYTPDFWNQQPSSVIGTAGGTFTFSNTYAASKGTHYLEFGVSAWVGHWHAKITINGVLMADVDTNVMTHVHVGFQVGGTTVSPTGTSAPTATFNPATIALTSGGTGTTTMTIATTSSTPTGTYTLTTTFTSAGISHSVTVTVNVLTPKYTLSLQGYDYDGQHEETLTLNTHQLVQLPAVDSSQNAGVYTSFSVDMTSLAVKGSNTLVFTHANWDCGVVDNTRNVVITDAAGVVIFSDPTVRPLSCTQSITYTFAI